MSLEIAKMLTISTAHIKEETAGYLDNEKRGELIVYSKDDYGWFIYIGYPELEDELESIPSELAAAIRFAEKNGCEWLCMDQDAETVDGLEVFEW